MSAEPEVFAELPPWLVEQMKTMEPVLLLEEFARIQPMSQEAFDAYKQLAADKTWSLGRCKFIMRNSDGSQEENNQEGGSTEA